MPSQINPKLIGEDAYRIMESLEKGKSIQKTSLFNKILNVLQKLNDAWNTKKINPSDQACVLLDRKVNELITLCSQDETKIDQMNETIQAIQNAVPILKKIKTDNTLLTDLQKDIKDLQNLVRQEQGPINQCLFLLGELRELNQATQGKLGNFIQSQSALMYVKKNPQQALQTLTAFKKALLEQSKARTQDISIGAIIASHSKDQLSQMIEQALTSR